MGDLQNNKPDLKKAKQLNIWAWVVTAVVLLLVGMMRRVKIPLPEGMDFSFLPPFHSSMNALAAIALIVALIFIKKKDMKNHQKAINVAMVFSVLFLLSYVIYHFTSQEVVFGDANKDGILDAAEAAAVGSMRTVYLAILIPHVILAAVVFPFILFTYIRAYTGQYEAHRKMAKYVFPIWLFVAVSGPICYWLLRPYY